MATSFYRTGTVAVTQNSKVVTGTGTKWTQGANKPLAGDVFIIDQEFHEIERIASDTELHLFTPFIGANKTNANYGIMRNASLNISSRIAASVSVAINQKQKMLTELNVWMTDTVGPTVPLTDVFGVVNQYVPLPLLVKNINDLINDSSNIASIVSEGKQARDQAVSANNAVQQAKTHIDQTKSQIDTIKGQVDQQEQTINTQHGEVSAWHTSAQQSAATATSEAGKAAADAVKTADDRVHIDAAKQSIDHSKASIDTSESHINTTKGQIDTINTGLTTKYNEVLSHASQVASDKNAVATLKGETETARDEAVDAKNVAQAIASPFIRGVDFTPSAAKEYPTMPSSGTVIMFRVVGVPIGTPYHFTTGDLKGKYVDDDDYLVAMRFSANVVAWSIMKLGRTSIASVNGHSERDITLDKTDIGLGNVNNFGATASVSDQSTQKYSLAKATYDAYQHADTALSVANQKWTFDQSAIDNRVTTVGAQNFAGKSGSTTEQFSVPKVPSSDNSATSKAYVDGVRTPMPNLLINSNFILTGKGLFTTKPIGFGQYGTSAMWLKTGNAVSDIAIVDGDSGNVGARGVIQPANPAPDGWMQISQFIESYNISNQHVSLDGFEGSTVPITISGYIYLPGAHNLERVYMGVIRPTTPQGRDIHRTGNETVAIEAAQIATNVFNKWVYLEKTVVVNVQDINRGMRFYIGGNTHEPASTPYVGNDIHLANVKVELSDKRTDYVTPTYGDEFTKTWRYFYHQKPSDVSKIVRATPMGLDPANSGLARQIKIDFPTGMRSTPNVYWDLVEYGGPIEQFATYNFASVLYNVQGNGNWGGFNYMWADANIYFK